MIGGECMPSNINIYSIKVNNISNNGSLNIGDALHNAHTANSKATGVNSSYGDTSPTSSGMENVYIDPDGNDQGDIANPANVNATQS
jgi:Spore germination protein gerPA/gerPF